MLVKIDASQLEWRTAVWLSMDPIGLQEINSGADIHSQNQKYFNLAEGDAGRLTAKTFLFRTIFRGSGWSFANDPNFRHVSDDPDFWDEMNSKFYKKYKGLDAWHKKLSQLVAARKPIISPFGREWMVPMRDDGSIPWTVLSNYPVQGTGADIMKIARISLASRLKKSGMRAVLVSTVHDDIKMDCPDEETDDIAKMAIQVFKDIPQNVKKLWGIDLPIPFPGEAKIGYNLKEMNKYVN